MLNFNSVMIGSKQPKVLASFYEKVFGKKADMQDGDWYGWQVGGGFFAFGSHSEVADVAKEPARTMVSFETTEVKKEFERLVKAGATSIKEPYEMMGGFIATLADPDGNYFQLMSPWNLGSKTKCITFR
jgi:predicted enzyme related to lactoylglutathione lyase